MGTPLKRDASGRISNFEVTDALDVASIAPRTPGSQLPVGDSGGILVAGPATFNGNVALGNANTDTITFTARINSHVESAGTGTPYDIGSGNFGFRNLYLSRSGDGSTTYATARALSANSSSPGAALIGVNTSGFNSAPAATDLQTVLAALDANSGGGSLQDAYSAGPDILQDANGAITIERGIDSTAFQLLRLVDNGANITTLLEIDARTGFSGIPITIFDTGGGGDAMTIQSTVLTGSALGLTVQVAARVPPNHGSNLLLQGGATTGTAAALNGGGVQILGRAGAPNSGASSGAGGAIVLTGGAAGNTSTGTSAAGGAITLTGGAGGTGNNGGNGGALTFRSGAAVAASGHSGNIVIDAGAVVTPGNGGSITIGGTNASSVVIGTGAIDIGLGGSTSITAAGPGASTGNATLYVYDQDSGNAYGVLVDTTAATTTPPIPFQIVDGNGILTLATTALSTYNVSSFLLSSGLGADAVGGGAAGNGGSLTLRGGHGGVGAGAGGGGGAVTLITGNANAPAGYSGNLYMDTGSALTPSQAGVINLGTTNATQINSGHTDVMFSHTGTFRINGNTYIFSVRDSNVEKFLVAGGNLAPNVRLYPTPVGSAPNRYLRQILLSDDSFSFNPPTIYTAECSPDGVISAYLGSMCLVADNSTPRNNGLWTKRSGGSGAYGWYQLGTVPDVEIAIEDGEVITNGDAVAASVTSGRCRRAEAGSAAYPNFLGVAMSGGTGDSGGTVAVRVRTCGVVNNGTGLTPNAPVYLSTAGAGGVTSTTPSGAGNLSLRIGFAYSATEYVLYPGQGVIL